MVTYHKTFHYMLRTPGSRSSRNVEPKPGTKPSAGHVAEVAREMKQNGVKVIIVESYRSREFSDLLARQGGGVVVPIPAGIGAEPGIDSYFAVMDAVVNRVVAALG